MSGTAEQYVVPANSYMEDGFGVGSRPVVITSAQLERYRLIEECARMLAQVVQDPFRTIRWKAMSDARRLGLLK